MTHVSSLLVRDSVVQSSNAIQSPLSPDLHVPPHAVADIVKKRALLRKLYHMDQVMSGLSNIHLLAPVNTRNIHWSLVYVSPTHARHYDSLDGNDSYVSEAIREWGTSMFGDAPVISEHAARTIHLSLMTQSETTRRDRGKTAPRRTAYVHTIQPETWECGLITVMTAARVIHNGGELVRGDEEYTSVAYIPHFLRALRAVFTWIESELDAREDELWQQRRETKKKKKKARTHTD